MFRCPSSGTPLSRSVPAMSTDEAGTGPPPPVPVRDVLSSVDPGPMSAPASPESRSSGSETEVALPGGDWVVRSGGRTRSGVPGDSGAPLLLALFHRRDPASGEVEAKPAREVWTVGRDMEEWDSTKLTDLLARSRPYRVLPDPPSPSRPSPPSPSPAPVASRRPSPPRPRRLD